MNWVKDLFTYLSDFFKWWVVIMPWQEGIRVRFGKYETRNPKATLSGIAMSKISEYITSHNLSECNPIDIESNVAFKPGEYGLDAKIKVTGFAPVRTFRLIQDNAKEYEI